LLSDLIRKIRVIRGALHRLTLQRFNGLTILRGEANFLRNLAPDFL